MSFERPNYNNFGLRDAYIIIVLSVISISPEIPVGSLSPGTEFTIRIEDLLLVVTGIVWLANPNWKKRFKLPNFFKYFSIYLVLVACISIGNSIYTDLSILRSAFYLLKHFEVMLFGVLVIAAVEDNRQLKTLRSAIIATALLNAAWAFYQIFTGDYGPLLHTANLTKARYGTSLIGQPTVVASGGYYIPAISIVVATIVTNERIRSRLSYLTICAVLLIAMAGAVSRASILGSIAAIFVIAGIYGGFRVWDSVKYFTPIFVITTAVLSVMSLPIIHRFLNAASGIITRLHFWAPLIEEAFPRAIIGWGAGSIYLLTYEEAHNYFLRTLIVSGIAGLFLFILFLTSICKYSHLLAVNSTSPIRRTLAMTALGTALGFSIIGLFQDSLLNVKIAEMFWITVGGLSASLILEWEE